MCRLLLIHHKTCDHTEIPFSKLVCEIDISNKKIIMSIAVLFLKNEKLLQIFGM